jgi:hypothetical protein
VAIDRVGRMMGRRLLRSCLTSLMAFAFIAVVLVCAGGVAFVVPGDDEAKMLAVMAALSCAMAAVMIVIGSYALVGAARRAKDLEKAFAPYIVRSAIYLGSGRQLHGTIRGRALDVYFFRGPTLELYIDARTGTRAGAGQANAIGSAAQHLLGKIPLNVSDPRFTNLRLYANDETWGRAWISDDTDRDLVARLVAPADATELPTLVVQPDSLLFRLAFTRVDNLTPARLGACLQDLCALAERIEALPAPAERIETSSMERRLRGPRGGVVNYLAPLSVGTIAAFFLVATIGLVVAYFLH